MSEILFECYGAPSVAYGIDSLFSYSYNGGRSGLVMDSSYTSTHVIPVVNSKPLLSQTTRLNWGRFQSAQYLLKLLRLKYPTFPGKISDNQAEDLSGNTATFHKTMRTSSVTTLTGQVLRTETTQFSSPTRSRLWCKRRRKS